MFNRSFPSLIPSILAITVAICLVTCGDGDDPVSSDKGTVVLDPSPDLINAPWTLAGPDGYGSSGNGDKTVTGLVSGEYSVNWGEVPDWTTPSSSTHTLTANQTVRFIGIYTELSATGTIIIDVSPDSIDAPWNVGGPDAYTASGAGDSMLTELTPGDYTVSWGALSGWTEPPSSTKTLLANEAISFKGSYAPQLPSGTIVIDTDPDSIDAPWDLAGPDGHSWNGHGDEILDQLTPGEYTVTWGTVSGWTAPASSSEVLLADALVTFIGTYVPELPKGTILIDPSPDSIHAPWTLAGPDSYSESGTGDEILLDMLTGEYTLVWGDVSGWFAPPNEHQTLTDGDTVTFRGFYIEEIDSGTVTDIDGNVYRTIKIGDQWWMAENLRVTRYRNGDTIQNASSVDAWTHLNSGGFCHYNNDSANAAIYGCLYNWLVITDLRRIAPEGWHVPTDEEWASLFTCLGDTTVAGGKMKETGTLHWNSPNTAATNESGFSALPGGHRSYDGYFYEIGQRAVFYASTGPSHYYGWCHDLYYLDSIVGRSFGRWSGFSIRCIKD